MLIDFIQLRIRCIDRKVHRLFDVRRDFIFDLIKQLTIRHLAFLQPFGEQLHRIAFALPLFFFLLGAVIRAVDITDVMAVEAVGVAVQKGRPLTAAGLFD